MRLFQGLTIWWWKMIGRKRMAKVCVGLRNDGSIDVDMADEKEEDGGWNFNNLDLEEAQFLKEELESAISRAKARGFPKAPTAPAQGKSDV